MLTVINGEFGIVWKNFNYSQVQANRIADTRSVFVIWIRRILLVCLFAQFSRAAVYTKHRT